MLPRKVDSECRDELRRVFATMSGKQNLKRLEQIRACQARSKTSESPFYADQPLRNDRILFSK
jgi:hypothetical protein